MGAKELKVKAQPKLTDEQVIKLERHWEEIIRTATGLPNVQVLLADSPDDDETET